MLPKRKGHEGPVEGWAKRSYYIVEVSFSEVNPIHRAIFYSGFLHRDPYQGKDVPSDGVLFNPSYERNYYMGETYFFRVVKKLQNVNKLMEEEA